MRASARHHGQLRVGERRGISQAVARPVSAMFDFQRVPAVLLNWFVLPRAWLSKLVAMHRVFLVSSLLVAVCSAIRAGRPAAMSDVGAIAGFAEAAADAFLDAAKALPSPEEAANIIDVQSAKDLAAAAGSAATSFLSGAQLPAPSVASIRVIEPGASGAQGARTSQAALDHALGELEERQRSNEESIAGVMASVGGAAAMSAIGAGA